jgi:hypothetical protein
MTARKTAVARVLITDDTLELARLQVREMLGVEAERLMREIKDLAGDAMPFDHIWQLELRRDYHADTL